MYDYGDYQYFVGRFPAGSNRLWKWGDQSERHYFFHGSSIFNYHIGARGAGIIQRWYMEGFFEGVETAEKELYLSSQ